MQERWLGLGLIVLLGCVPVSADDDDDDDDSTPPHPVTVEVTLLDAVSGGGVAATLSAPDGSTVSTDGEGRAAVTVDGASPYVIAVEAAGYAPYQLVGFALVDTQEFITLMGDRTTTSQVYGLLGLTPDATRGTVVAGLDEADWTPAEGAGARLDATHDPPFLFAGMGPQAGDTVGPGNLGVVSFPNVEPGPATLTVVPGADQDCWLREDESALSIDLEVEPDTVTVALFVCGG